MSNVGQYRRDDSSFPKGHADALICGDGTYPLVGTGLTARSGRRESNSRYQLGKLAGLQVGCRQWYGRSRVESIDWSSLPGERRLVERMVGVSSARVEEVRAGMITSGNAVREVAGGGVLRYW